MILESMIKAYLSDTLRHVQVAGTIAARRVVMPGDQPAVYAAGWADAVQAMASALELMGEQPMIETTPRSIAAPHAWPARVIALTQREAEVAKLIISGLTTQQIAGRLTVEHSTVRAHRRSISKKCGTSSKAGLLAIRAEWEELHES